jgi:hypothetical protein
LSQSIGTKLYRYELTKTIFVQGGPVRYELFQFQLSSLTTNVNETAMVLIFFGIHQLMSVQFDYNNNILTYEVKAVINTFWLFRIESKEVISRHRFIDSWTRYNGKSWVPNKIRISCLLKLSYPVFLINYDK